MVVIITAGIKHPVITAVLQWFWRIHRHFCEKKSQLTFDHFGLILQVLRILINWKHFKIIPSLCGSISTKQTLILTILVLIKLHLITDMCYENSQTLAGGLTYVFLIILAFLICCPISQSALRKYF